MRVTGYVLATLLPLLAASLNVKVRDGGLNSTSTTTVTEDATLTITTLVNSTTEPVVENVTVTFTNFISTTTTSISVTLAPSSVANESVPIESSNDVAGYTITAYSPDTPIDGLPMQAAGHRFWLGGEPAAYCPDIVKESGSCPAGNTTTIWECSMAVAVPGGQAIYATSDGQITYTVAHSVSFPNPGSLEARCPFCYAAVDGSHHGEKGELRPASWAFGANSLMACPIAGDSWQVLLAIANATVPSGNIRDCYEFVALTSNSTKPGAWQYD